MIMDRQRRVALWRLLRPRDGIFERTDGGTVSTTPYVVCSYLLVGLSRGKAVRVEGPWGLAISTHALCRLLDRTAFRADPIAAMLEAHDMLLGASADCGTTVLTEREWAVPAGPGGFLATVRGVKLPPTMRSSWRAPKRGFLRISSSTTKAPRWRHCASSSRGTSWARDCCCRQG
jgi:hypothetical protein